MSRFDRIFSLTSKDLKNWSRTPFLIVIAVVPLLIMSLFVGLFISRAESMPAGIILEDNDPLALEVQTYLTTFTSGTGLTWFTIEDLPPNEVLKQFEEGKILCYIQIPRNLSTRLQAGEIVALEVQINNINDDVTKNVLQRVHAVCNHFNEDLTVGELTYHSPVIEFKPIVSVDLRFIEYVASAICALTLLLCSGVNVTTTTAHEFEEGTIKEIMMGAAYHEIVIGKLLAGFVQTLICYGIVSAALFLLYRFIPTGNIFFLLLLMVWGALSFSSIGFLTAVRFKQTIPAALSILVLNIAGWWIGGGLVPAELWSGQILGTLAQFWPGTYFFRSFTNLVLLDKTSTLLFDLVVTGIFGGVMFLLATRLFMKEAKLQ